MNLCQLIPTHYDKHQIITSLADDRIEDEGYEMNYEWHKQAGSKFQGVSPVEKKAKEDRNEEKGEFSAACEIEKQTVREENR